MSTGLASAATVPSVVCVRVTSLISPVVLVVTRKPPNEPDMTQKRRVWPELTTAIDPMTPIGPSVPTLWDPAHTSHSRLLFVGVPSRPSLGLLPVVADRDLHEVSASRGPAGVDAAPTAPQDLVAMLDLLAGTIVEALGFGVACINIARPDGALQVVSVAGDEGARAALLGTTDSAETWDRLLAASEPWGRLRFADHRNQETYLDAVSWVPDIEPVDAPDAWHPEDALFAPLTASDGTRIGVLSVDLPHDGRVPDGGTRRTLEAFAVSAALAIEHATLRARAEASEQSYRRLARYDQLTGVGNRSVLIERLEHLATARPDQRPLLALVFVDLDGFKDVNDQFSHVAGDHVLQAVAHRVEAVVRAHDTVCRWGGDEFLVLLESLDDQADGVAVAERIAVAIAEPMWYDEHELTITASLGVAFTAPDDVLDVDELVRRADAAMYRVKRESRNGCAVFDPDRDHAV
jgi:diguanylate cyclase (GGDEF)-like protein